MLKKNCRLIPILTLVFLSINAFSQEEEDFFDWQALYKIDGEKCESVTDMAISSKDDVVITGIYEDSGGARIESSGETKIFAVDSDTFPQSHSTIFLARYNKDGKLKWAINAFGESGIHPWDLHCDEFGNSIICGNFRDQAIFHSTDGKEKVIKAVITDHHNWMDQHPLNYFIAKYDSKGRLCWVRVGLSNTNSVAFQSESDSIGNIFVRAYCVGNSIAFNDIMLLPHSESGNYIQNYSVILIKYSPNGKEEWIIYGGNASVKEMKVDKGGNVSLDCLNSGNITLFSSSNKFWKLKKEFPLEHTTLLFDTNAELKDSISREQSNHDPRIFKSLIAKDGRKYALIQASPIKSSGQDFSLIWKDKTYKTQRYDIFLACYDADGNQDWILQFNGKEDEKPLDIILDNYGNIILSACYMMNLTLNDINGDSIHLNSKLRSLFVAMYTPEGKLITAENTGSLSYTFWSFTEYLNLAVDSKNRLYISGQVNMTSEIGKHKLILRGPRRENREWEDEQGIECYKYSDGFLAMADIILYPNDSTMPALQENETDSIAFIDPVSPNTRKKNQGEIDVLLYPNPVGVTQDIVNVRLELDKVYTIQWTIHDANGKLLQEKKGNYESGTQYEQFSFAGYSPGIYLMRIYIGDLLLIKKIVVAG